MNRFNQVEEEEMGEMRPSALPRAVVTIALFSTLITGCAVISGPSTPEVGLVEDEQWRGVHFFSPGHGGVPDLKRAISEVLAPMGVNVIVLEVNYGYEFESHPELRWQGAISDSPDEGALTEADARELSDLCSSLGIRLIPQFNCLGHQSWQEVNFPLLVQYPEMNETPGETSAYCLSWCPQHPDVNKIIFDLLDELVDAFDADTIHVGMDEVFLIAEDTCPRCSGGDPAELFAMVVNDLYQHLVGERGLTMLMWGDRLIDAEEMGYSTWEASGNGTAPAIDMIPTDIIICDWHYGLSENYPSVLHFQQKGFRVWPTSWKEADAAQALLICAQSNSIEGRMLGHLCTTWYGPDVPPAILREVDESELNPEAVKAAETIRVCMELLADRSE